MSPVNAELRLNLPGRWRFVLSADRDGFGINLVRQPEPQPAPEVSAPTPSATFRPEPERSSLEGGSFTDTERDASSFGFTFPRWSPLGGEPPDP